MLLIKLLSTLLAPINLYALMLLMSVVLWWRRRIAAALTVLVLSSSVLFVLSMPWTAQQWLKTLEPEPQRFFQSADPIDAIVSLGGGQARNHSVFGSGHFRPSALALERLVQAARLQRQHHVPLVLSGGKGIRDSEAEALGMHRLLVDLGVDPTMLRLEVNSRNTCENALNALNLLAQTPEIKHIVVVTHRWHMPRALWCFQRYGEQTHYATFIIKAAPVYVSGVDHAHFPWLPSAKALLISSTVTREHIGLVWYRLRYAF